MITKSELKYISKWLMLLLSASYIGTVTETWINQTFGISTFFDKFVAGVVLIIITLILFSLGED
ncbi:MAG: hypothetical protein ACP5D2_02725 [Candidatus Nanoarchaeia archaeon]